MLPNDIQRKNLLTLDDWARSWAREESDKAIGADIVRLLTPFLTDLVDQGLALNTLRRHKGNLYYLGSRVLDLMTQFPEDAHATVGEALDDILVYCEYEGPEMRDASEAEQRSFDATCRRVYKFRGLQAGRQESKS